MVWFMSSERKIKPIKQVALHYGTIRDALVNEYKPSSLGLEILTHSLDLLPQHGCTGGP